MTFFLGTLTGAYLLGFTAVLWACDEPWPDRAFIAVFWPFAVAWNLCRD